MARHLSLDFPMLQDSSNWPLNVLKRLRAVIAIAAIISVVVLLFIFYFHDIFFAISVYIYFGVFIAAIVAAIFLFGTAIMYPLLLDLYYRILYVLRAIGLIYSFFI